MTSATWFSGKIGLGRNLLRRRFYRRIGKQRDADLLKHYGRIQGKRDCCPLSEQIFEALSKFPQFVLILPLRGPGFLPSAALTCSINGHIALPRLR